MTKVVPYEPPEELWAVIRVGDNPENIYVLVANDDWLEVKTGLHWTGGQMFDLVNGGEIDESHEYSWINRRGYTLLIPEEL